MLMRRREHKVIKRSEDRISLREVARTAVAVVVFASFAGRARAEMYYTRDADGAYHFTNMPTAGSMPFVPTEPLARLPEDDRPADRRRMQPARDTSQYDDLIAEYANTHSVDPGLVKAVIRGESAFNRLAVSEKGASGLMQLMPETARRHGCRNVFDARQNIEAGVKHLRMLLDGYDDLPRALAAYNAGSAAVDRYRGVPPYAETRDYVTRVLRFHRVYQYRQRLPRRSAARHPGVAISFSRVGARTATAGPAADRTR